MFAVQLDEKTNQIHININAENVDVFSAELTTFFYTLLKEINAPLFAITGALTDALIQIEQIEGVEATDEGEAEEDEAPPFPIVLGHGEENDILMGFPDFSGKKRGDK